MIDSKNFVNSGGIPLGFGMALAQNSKAMEYFSSLSEQQRQAIIAGTHSISSKQEMRAYVNQMMNQSQAPQGIS